MDDKDNDAFIISGNNDIVLGIDDLGVASGFTLDEITSVDIGNLDWVSMNSDTITSSGVTWTDSGYTLNDPKVNINGQGIEIRQEADIKIGDRSMKEFMDKVEDQLAILRPAPELEEKWDKLKELRRQYEECKQDILEKEKIMKILKED